MSTTYLEAKSVADSLVAFVPCPEQATYHSVVDGCSMVFKKFRMISATAILEMACLDYLQALLDSS